MQLPTPNTIKQKRGFYVSYNTADHWHYGDVTTAIVPDDMSRFYVLLGDHRNQLKELNTLEECVAYFHAHPDQIHLPSARAWGVIPE